MPAYYRDPRGITHDEKDFKKIFPNTHLSKCGIEFRSMDWPGTHGTEYWVWGAEHLSCTICLGTSRNIIDDDDIVHADHYFTPPEQTLPKSLHDGVTVCDIHYSYPNFWEADGPPAMATTDRELNCILCIGRS